MSEYVGSENDFVLTKELDLNSNLLQHTPAHTNPIPKKKSMNSNRVGIEYVRWTKEEEEKLIHLVEVTGGRNWVEIGRLMNNERTAKACNHKYQDLTKSSMQHSQNSLLMNIDGNMLNHEILQGMIQNTIENDSNNNNAGNDADNGCTGNEGDLEEKSKKNSTIRTSQGHNRILWSAEEDKMLLEFISENANAVHIPWSKLAIPGRSRKACSNRWDYQLKCKFMRQEEFQPVSLPRPSQQAQVQSQQSPQVPETGESIPLGNQIVMEKNVSDDVNLVGKIGSDHAGMEDGIANNKRSDLNTMNNRMENNGDTMQQNQNNSAAAMSSDDAESVNMLTSGKINNQILNAEGNTHCSNALNPVHHSNPDGNIDEHTTRNSNTNNELSTMVMDSYRDASQSHNMVHMSHMDGLAQYSDTNHHHNSDMGCNNDINHLQQKHQQGDLGQISNFNHTEMSNQHQMMHDNDDFDNDANMPNNHLKRSKKSAKSNTGAISSKDSVASGDNQRWTAEEDASLYEYVQMHGFQNIPWAKVNKIVPNRSTIACRKRWSNYLKRKHEDAHSTHSGPVFGHHMHSSQSNPLHAMFGDRQNRMDTGVSMYPQIVQNTNHMNADANAPVMESYVSNEEPIEYIENKRSRSEMENDSTEQIEAMDSHGHIENPNPNPNEQGNGQCMNNTSVNRLDDTAYESNLNQTSVPLAKHGMMWSAAEDELLLKYVCSFGYKNIPWCKINSNVIPGRHAMSCESRWRKYLKMKIFGRTAGVDTATAKMKKKKRMDGLDDCDGDENNIESMQRSKENTLRKLENDMNNHNKASDSLLNHHSSLHRGQDGHLKSDGQDGIQNQGQNQGSLMDHNATDIHHGSANHLMDGLQHMDHSRHDMHHSHPSNHSNLSNQQLLQNMSHGHPHHHRNPHGNDMMNAQQQIQYSMGPLQHSIPEQHFQHNGNQMHHQMQTLEHGQMQNMHNFQYNGLMQSQDEMQNGLSNSGQEGTSNVISSNNHNNNNMGMHSFDYQMPVSEEQLYYQHAQMLHDHQIHQQLLLTQQMLQQNLEHHHSQHHQAQYQQQQSQMQAQPDDINIPVEHSELNTNPSVELRIDSSLQSDINGNPVMNNEGGYDDGDNTMTHPNDSTQYGSMVQEVSDDNININNDANLTDENSLNTY